jgi:CTD nuclear envelope phosphatase 1
VQEYADPVIDWLDGGHGILGRRFFREVGTLHLYLVHVLITEAVQSCTQLANGSYTKDLTLVESDLARVCLIDNSPISYNVNPGMTSPICVFHSH